MSEMPEYAREALDDVRGRERVAAQRLARAQSAFETAKIEHERLASALNVLAETWGVLPDGQPAPETRYRSRRGGTLEAAVNVLREANGKPLRIAAIVEAMRSAGTLDINIERPNNAINTALLRFAGKSPDLVQKTPDGYRYMGHPEPTVAEIETGRSADANTSSIPEVAPTEPGVADDDDIPF